MSDFLFNTDLNNQKILLNTGQTLSVGSPSFVGSYTYDHNLGYIPAASVWYEAKPGQWFPLSVRQYTSGSPFDYLELTGEFYLTTTSFVLTIRNAGLATSCNVWIRIYLDD